MLSQSEKLAEMPRPQCWIQGGARGPYLLSQNIQKDLCVVINTLNKQWLQILILMHNNLYIPKG